MPSSPVPAPRDDAAPQAPTQAPRGRSLGALLGALSEGVRQPWSVLRGHHSEAMVQAAADLQYIERTGHLLHGEALWGLSTEGAQALAVRAGEE